MRSKIALLLIVSAASGCTTATADQPQTGIAAVNVPVVTRSDYVFDAAAPDGSLSATEAARLDGWFSGLNLGYGDSVHVEGPYAATARPQVAAIVGRYGMLLEPGSPVSGAPIPPGAVRVVVVRARASVPGCPNWNDPASPNYENKMMSNFGCSVNSNLAAMVANPTDLIHGREGDAAIDASTGAKAIAMYRNWPLTGVTEGQAQRPFKKPDEAVNTGNK